LAFVILSGWICVIRVTNQLLGGNVFKSRGQIKSLADISLGFNTGVKIKQEVYDVNQIGLMQNQTTKLQLEQELLQDSQK
jgi:hypothetical protein